MWEQSRGSSSLLLGTIHHRNPFLPPWTACTLAYVEFVDGFFWITVAVLAVAHAFARSNVRLRNALLLAASYGLVLVWAKVLVIFLLYATAVSFAAGIWMENHPSQRRQRSALWIAIPLLLAPLALYKTFLFGPLLQGSFAVFPLGISFYTLQSIGYLVDVGRGTTPAVRDPIHYALFLAFFPKFIAGPIERSDGFLKQLSETHPASAADAWEGLTLIFWGITQKVVIASAAYLQTSMLFPQDQELVQTHLFAALLALPLFIYADFAGYTNVARGLGKLFGFDLLQNFSLPYFANGAAEFWRRWHSSLSGWMRDYVYIPLGGNRRGSFATYRNILITFLLTGLWHFVSWPFFFWGVYHGVLVCADRFVRSRADRWGAAKFLTLPAVGIPLTFAAVTFGWILFFCQSMGQFHGVLSDIVSTLRSPAIALSDPGILLMLLLWATQLAIDACSNAGSLNALRWHRMTRVAFMVACFYAITLSQTGPSAFTYANF